MLSTYAKRISSLFVRADIIKEKDFEIYAYSFEVLLANVLSAVALVVIALISGTFLETIYFLIGFIPVRELAGGYHASTHLRCFLIMLGVYSVFLVAYIFIPAENYVLVTRVCVLLSICLIWKLSPVEDDNKPLTQNEKSFLRQRSRNVSLVYVLVVIVLTVSPGTGVVAFCVSLGLLAVSLSLFAARIKSILVRKRV